MGALAGRAGVGLVPDRGGYVTRDRFKAGDETVGAPEGADLPEWDVGRDA